MYSEFPIVVLISLQSYSLYCHKTKKCPRGDTFNLFFEIFHVYKITPDCVKPFRQFAARLVDVFQLSADFCIKIQKPFQVEHVGASKFTLLGSTKNSVALAQHSLDGLPPTSEQSVILHQHHPSDADCLF